MNRQMEIINLNQSKTGSSSSSFANVADCMMSNFKGAPSTAEGSDADAGGAAGGDDEDDLIQGRVPVNKKRRKISNIFR